MEEYFIYFHKDYTVEEHAYRKGDLLKVDQENMFYWVEQAHFEDVLISIYKAKMVCDLS